MSFAVLSYLRLDVANNPGGSSWDKHVSYNFRCAAAAMLPELVKRL
jgi:hypothetical protein